MVTNEIVPRKSKVDTNTVIFGFPNITGHVRSLCSWRVVGPTAPVPTRSLGARIRQRGNLMKGIIDPHVLRRIPLVQLGGISDLNPTSPNTFVQNMILPQLTKNKKTS